MQHGRGKYDEFVTQVRNATDADLVIVVVLGGTRGHGFSVQCIDPILEKQVPALLRLIATNIDQEHAALEGAKGRN